MPASRRELLDALLKYPPGSENRLTELFATTLATHDAFARRLFERVGIALPEDGVRFEAFTQRTVAARCRPDMLVSAYENGHLRAQVWSEHKTGSGFRDLQLDDYLAALQEARAHLRAGTGEFDAALTSIVAERADEDEPQTWTALTWQEVAELANQTGRAWAGAGWADAALQPDAPARERVLHEFLWYLEQEGFAVVDALDTDNVLALRKAAETTFALETLLERVALYLKQHYEPNGLGSFEDGRLYYQLFDLPENSWARRIRTAGWRADLELLVAGDDAWSTEETGEPAFGAGFTLDEPLYEALAAEQEWLNGLAERELSLMPYEGNTRIFRTKRMSELIGAGETLDDQARALADWTRESFARVGAYSPGDEWEPPRRRGGRGRRPDSENGDGHVDDEALTREVSERDIRAGQIRIPQGASKGRFFPAVAGEVDVVLRGRELTCRWNPRFASGADRRERSGVLRVGRVTLEELVHSGEQLRISADGDGGAIRLD
jgi:hypothetical protein